MITISVAVTQNAQGKATLESELMARSDPDNRAMYGRWLSKAAVDGLVAPAPADVAAARAWLGSAGAAVQQTAAGDWLWAAMRVGDAEALLRGRYHRFQHASSNSSVALRLASSYSLPAGVAAAVDLVGPAARFPAVMRPFARFGPIGGGVTPSSLRKLYNATDAVAAPGTKNIQACSSFLNQYYSPSDLKQFFSKYAPDAKVTTPTVVGPNEASDPGIEAELDIQYLMGVGRDVPTQFWSTHGKQPHNPENEPFLVWLTNLANVSDDKMPHTMSVSYGDNEPGVDEAYAARVNVEFQKAGARGMSLLFSSGDGGVSGGQSQPCTKFVPTFPAGSPWVTAVGGTTKTKPEVCASFSSGGFSNYFGRPAYQDAAVKAYLSSGASGLPSTALFNASGAGIPDVAAQGENFDVVVSGETTPVDGTSCSSPAFTAIVSLLNEARMAAGKSSLGYLNQLIYKKAGPAGAFNDVTEGSNPGCGTRGFPATKGWDPVTGWGTPKFEKLKQIVLDLP